MAVIILSVKNFCSTISSPMWKVRLEFPEKLYPSSDGQLLLTLLLRTILTGIIATLFSIYKGLTMVRKPARPPDLSRTEQMLKNDKVDMAKNLCRCVMLSTTIYSFTELVS